MGKTSGLSNVYVISAMTTIGGLNQGFDVSSMSAIIGKDAYKAYFNHPDSVLQGGITASMAGGSLLGSLFSSWTSDRFGRRDSLFIACIIWLVGSTLMCAVQNVAMLIVSRIINGFAVGMLTSQGPILIAEISLPHQRGRLLSLQQWMIALGILIMYFISYGASFMGNNGYQSTSWLELFNSRNLIRVHCGIFTHIWAQLTGTNAMMYYIVYIFEMAGLPGNTTLLSASIQYILNVIMTLPALILIDQLPRRRLFIFGALTMGVLQFTQARLMASYGHYVPGGLDGSPTVHWKVTNSKASKAIIACSYLFISCYAPTWGPLGWAYPPEIIPLYIRSKAVSLATFFNWGCNFAVTFFTPPAFQNIQWTTYCVFGTFCIVAAIHVFFLFQETCGKYLEEIDEIFENQSVWAFKAKVEPSRLTIDIEQAKDDLDVDKTSVNHVK
ncbi:hypothetical protein N7488_001556 [Penicillium malachiteum]|nr:hypothetical protein N7488_001556 [Penicillium malachiteum]